MQTFQYYKPEPLPSPNSKSDLLPWEDAVYYLQDLGNSPVLAVLGYWARHPNQPKITLDIDHIWCIKTSKEKAKDFLFCHLGLVDFFEIHH